MPKPDMPAANDIGDKAKQPGTGSKTEPVARSHKSAKAKTPKASESPAAKAKPAKARNGTPKSFIDMVADALNVEKPGKAERAEKTAKPENPEKPEKAARQKKAEGSKSAKYKVSFRLTDEQKRRMRIVAANLDRPYQHILSMALDAYLNDLCKGKMCGCNCAQDHRSAPAQG